MENNKIITITDQDDQITRLEKKGINEILIKDIGKRVYLIDREDNSVFGFLALIVMGNVFFYKNISSEMEIMTSENLKQIFVQI